MFDGARKKLRSVFLVGFLLTIALALTGYIDSSFVGIYVSVDKVGVLFSLGSIVAIVFLAYLPKMLSRFKIGNIFHGLSAIYLVSILGMIYIGASHLFQILFILYLASGIAIYFCIDLLVEHFSSTEITGGTRGFYLTIYNLAYLVGPLLAGIILKNNSFEIIYLLAGVFVVMMTLLYMRDLERIEIVSHHHRRSWWRNVLKLTKNKNLFNVYLLSLMLSFFFSWMAIYVPIYLYQQIGFGWDKIGMIFALMHIPYITLEVAIGRFADKWQAEKKLINIGLVIIGLSTMALFFIPGANFVLWAVGLSLTRVGASFVQVSTESYFFKRVTEADSDIIAVFRNASPVAYILGPLVATFFLSFVSYNHLFIILGVIMMLVLFLSSRLKNGKHKTHK